MSSNQEGDTMEQEDYGSTESRKSTEWDIMFEAKEGSTLGK